MEDGRSSKNNKISRIIESIDFVLNDDETNTAAETENSCPSMDAQPQPVATKAYDKTMTLPLKPLDAWGKEIRDEVTALCGLMKYLYERPQKGELVVAFPVLSSDPIALQKRMPFVQAIIDQPNEVCQWIYDCSNATAEINKASKRVVSNGLQLTLAQGHILSLLEEKVGKRKMKAYFLEHCASDNMGLEETWDTFQQNGRRGLKAKCILDAVYGSRVRVSREW
jgi:hypothetical protein